ncbi:hypothetical protein FXO38_10455, partial [Capsicum annuum]
MDQRLLVDSITKETTDWTCKVQEQQVSIVLYGDDIPKYENLFLLFHTYLVSCAKARDPRGYSIRAGTTLLDHLQEHPVILAKCIGITEFRGVLRLETRYQTTILPNPQYVQAITLMNWVKQNEQILSSYTLRSSSSSTSSLNLAPIDEDQVQSVSNIPQSLSTVQTVPMKGRISLPDYSQSFYLLACSNCNHYLCLFPFRCHFNIDITDFSGTIAATVSKALAERILSLTVDQIYDKVVVQKQPLSISSRNRQLDRELFKLQLQKSAFRFPDQKSDALAVASFTETEQTGKRQKIEPSTSVKRIEG